MEVTLDLRKSTEENAVTYFEAAKKAKRRLNGAEKALEKSKAKLTELLEKKETEGSVKTENVYREKKWYEKFRWFFSSEGFLCIGGRDATTNDIIIKKHAEENDVVFHTEMSGSPFFVVKSKNEKVGEITMDEAAIAVASFSRAWRLGLSHAEIFHADPSQLSKTPKAGEYLEKGAFIIKGRVKKQMAELKLAVGALKDGSIMCGPESAVKKNCGRQIVISRGNAKASDAARKIRKILGGEIDDIIRILPSGGVKLSTQ